MTPVLEALKELPTWSELEALSQERWSWMDRDSLLIHKTAYEGMDFPTPSIKKYDQDYIQTGDASQLTNKQADDLRLRATNLIPWLKGPFELYGMQIDAEWRSDYKWKRLLPNLPSLEGKKILDVGCNNGYFMFRMLQENPEWVLGIDPVGKIYAQFQFLNNLARESKLHYELWGVEHLNLLPGVFDMIFSMGIIYHHRSPMEQLLDLKKALAPGGHLIIETIGVEGEENTVLFPPDRFAQMKNVWFLPTTSAFVSWVERAGFHNVKLISDVPMTYEEQHETQWCPGKKLSIKDISENGEGKRTIEGHPMPRRMCIVAQKNPRAHF